MESVLAHFSIRAHWICERSAMRILWQTWHLFTIFLGKFISFFLFKNNVLVHQLRVAANFVKLLQISHVGIIKWIGHFKFQFLPKRRNIETTARQHGSIQNRLVCLVSHLKQKPWNWNSKSIMYRYFLLL